MAQFKIVYGTGQSVAGFNTLEQTKAYAIRAGLKGDIAIYDIEWGLHLTRFVCKRIVGRMGVWWTSPAYLKWVEDGRKDRVESLHPVFDKESGDETIRTTILG